VVWSIFTSPQETPWDRFSKQMNTALRSASAQFAMKTKRRIALGSPVKISEAGGDLIRVPIEMKGGNREFSVAYLHVKSPEIDGVLNNGRLNDIARAAVQASEPYVDRMPDKPIDVVLTYP
jgi:hypothetical protein